MLSFIFPAGNEVSPDIPSVLVGPRTTTNSHSTTGSP